MIEKRSPYAFLIALIVTVLAAVIAASTGMSSAPAACAGTDAPREAVTGFFDALCANDMQLADSYVGYYSGLGFSGELSSAFERRLYDELVSSYSYSLDGELRRGEGGGYVQTVNFRHLDLVSATDGISEGFEDDFKKSEAALTFDQIYNEDGSYTAEVFDKAVGIALDRIFENKEAFTVTESIDVEVMYSSHQWQIVVSDRLADAILGGTEGNS